MTPAPLYFDCNATTPLAPEALAEMVDAMQHAWANPSSTHAPGQAARRVLADARSRVAAFLGCLGSELVFTSGATEANHAAVLGALAAGRARGRTRLVLSSIEHPGLLALGARLQAEGVAVELLPVDGQGRIDLDAAADAIREDTALVCAMGANNETGVIQPVEALAALAHDRGALLHVDATQLAGKARLSFGGSGADTMAVSAHKIGGPKGIGALVVRKGLALPPLLSGRQERQRRGGTENLPGIAGFAAAGDRVAHTLDADLAAMRLLRERLEHGLLAALPGTVVFGAKAERLPNTVCVRFEALDADAALNRLEKAGIVASSGAACSAGGTQPSHVLLAMGCSPLHARAGVRFSFGPGHRAEDIDRAVAAAARAIGPLLAQALAA